MLIQKHRTFSFPKTLFFNNLTLVERENLDIFRPYYLIMKIEFNNLYTHYISTKSSRFRDRTSKQITWICIFNNAM